MTGPSAVRDALPRLATTRFASEDAVLLQGALHSRRLVLLKSLLTRLERLPDALPPPAREDFERHWLLLERAERSDPAALRTTLGYPAVGSWLTQTLAAPPGPGWEQLVGHFGAVAAGAALRAGIVFRTFLAAPDGTLALPGLGVLHPQEPRFRLAAGPHTVRITVPGRRAAHVLTRRGGRLSPAGPPWQAVPPLPGSPAVLDDLDPYRAPRTGVGGESLPAGERTTAERELWQRRWREALRLMASADPERVAETSALLRCLVPLARPDHRAVAADAQQASATLRSAPGAVLATVPATAEDLADVLVHELQHSKLAVLADLAPLHRAGPEAAYEVPWRPDPRPFDGVLHGTYAHLALADFWLRARDRPGATADQRAAAGARHERCHDQVSRTLPIVLGSGQLTCTGREFAVRMRTHHQSLGRSRGAARH
ncbi:HEXXH motif-containing putative peptide modification protein [Streptomyces sp. NPDC004647]|uniref:aKG-HExxH-type peptide beta-hydroxylase n=1 Tax=Streptomyces sp. NPDC004647 TaxID=3154671 RepID=UPI0033A9D677